MSGWEHESQTRGVRREEARRVLMVKEARGALVMGPGMGEAV